MLQPSLGFGSYISKTCRDINLPKPKGHPPCLTGTQVFSILELLLIYLKQYGTVVPPTDVHRIHPVFPDLPTHRINRFDGYYGPLNADTHNLYEEIPCLGVIAEAIRQAISNIPPGYTHHLLTLQS